MEKERLYHLDIAKSLVIIGTVLLHVGSLYVYCWGGYNVVFVCLMKVVMALHCAYSMPLFFILRGYYNRPCSLSEEIIKGCKRLIVPMFLLYYWGDQWFCYAMFFALIEYNLVRRIKNKYVQLLVFLLLACVGSYIRTHGYDWRYMSLGLMLAPFFWIGERGKWIVDSDKFGIFCVIPYFICVALVFLYVSEENIENYALNGDSYPGIKNLFIIYPSAIFGASVIFWLSRKIRRNRCLEYIGRNSMVFFLFHMSLILLLYQVEAGYLNYLQDTGAHVLSAIVYILTASLCFVSCYCVSKFVNRYCPWVIGKGL